MANKWNEKEIKMGSKTEIFTTMLFLVIISMLCGPVVGFAIWGL